MAQQMRPQTITLRSDLKFGSRPPAGALGEFLRLIPDVAGRSVRMALEGRSVGSGPRPDWLARAMDIRFAGQKGRGEQTILTFESYRLIDAAPAVFDQRELFPVRPSPELTGIDLFGEAIADIANTDRDSVRFDAPLLRDVLRFREAMHGSFTAAEFHQSLRTDRQKLVSAVLTPEVLSNAATLYRQTPSRQAAKIAGKLDMARISNRAFALELTDGTETRGILTHGDLTDYRHLLGKSVVATGTAIFRPSGRLLRIDAQELRAAAESDAFFSKFPKPHKSHAIKPLPSLLMPAGGGMADIFGRWPGDESDAQIEAALREIG